MGLLTDRPTDQVPIVFTAQSKVYHYCRDAVCEFVLEKGAIPVHPFRLFEWTVFERGRELVRRANNNVVRVCDELWVFGETIADGVLFEILYARELHKPIRYFTISGRADEIRETCPEKFQFEPQVYLVTGMKRDQLIAKITGRDHRQYPLFAGLDDE
jgi:hypothetical protein